MASWLNPFRATRYSAKLRLREAVIRGRRIAAEGAGIDVDGIESRIALIDSFRLIDGDEARRAAVQRGRRNRVIDRMSGRRACGEQHIDLFGFDGVGGGFRIDKRDLYLPERDAIVIEHRVQQVLRRHAAGDDADAMPGELRDLVQLVGAVRIGGVGVLAAVVAAVCLFVFVGVALLGDLRVLRAFAALVVLFALGAFGGALGGDRGFLSLASPPCRPFLPFRYWQFLVSSAVALPLSWRERSPAKPGR